MSTDARPDAPVMPEPAAAYMHGCNLDIAEGASLFTAEQMHAYAREYAKTAICQPAKATICQPIAPPSLGAPPAGSGSTLQPPAAASAAIPSAARFTFLVRELAQAEFSGGMASQRGDMRLLDVHVDRARDVSYEIEALLGLKHATLLEF